MNLLYKAIILFTIFCLLSCSYNSGDKKLVRDNLYINDEGQLFFKVIDVSILGEKHVRWIERFYHTDSFNMPCKGQLINEVIDIHSWKFDNTIVPKEGLISDYYSDEDHYYYNSIQADGGFVHYGKNEH